MKCTKHLIGALMAALAALAFVASAAQANPEFYIEKTAGSVTLAGLNLVSGLTEGTTVATGGSELLVESGVAIFCEHQAWEGLINNEFTQGLGLVEISYKKNCRGLGLEATCTVDEPIVMKAKFTLVLHEVSGKKEPYVLFQGELEPKEERLAQIKILNNGPKTCLIAGTYNVHGLLAAEALLGLVLKQVFHFNDAVYKLICGKKARGGLDLCTGGLFLGSEQVILDSSPALELLSCGVIGCEENADKKWEIK